MTIIWGSRKSRSSIGKGWLTVDGLPKKCSFEAKNGSFAPQRTVFGTLTDGSLHCNEPSVAGQ